MRLRHALRWNGALVGYIEEPDYDGWWMYGRWVSASHPWENKLFASVPTLSALDADEDELEAAPAWNDQWLEHQTGDGTWHWCLLTTRPQDGRIGLRLFQKPSSEELREQAELTRD